MMKILTIESGYPLRSRNQRITKTILENNLGEVRHILWDREMKNTSAIENTYIYKQETQLASKFKKILKLKGFYFFVKEVIRQYSPDIVIASHWDNMVLSASMKKKYGFKLVYENHDMPSDGSLLLQKIFIKLESMGLEKVDGTIFSSRFFIDHYKPHNHILLDNKPSNKILNVNKEKSSKLRIGFFGTLRYFQLFKNLIDVVADNPDYELYLGGRGQDTVLYREYINEKELSNVKLLGGFDYNEIGKLYSFVDLIWAAYPSKSYNVKYATSNKFFDAFAFKTPCVISENTAMGAYAYRKRLCYTVDPYSKESIRNLLLQATYDKEENFLRLDGFTNYNETLYWENDTSKLITFLNKL